MNASLPSWFALQCSSTTAKVPATAPFLSRQETPPLLLVHPMATNCLSTNWLPTPTASSSSSCECPTSTTTAPGCRWPSACTSGTWTPVGCTEDWSACTWTAPTSSSSARPTRRTVFSSRLTLCLSRWLQLVPQRQQQPPLKLSFDTEQFYFFCVCLWCFLFVLLFHVFAFCFGCSVLCFCQVSVCTVTKLWWWALSSISYYCIFHYFFDHVQCVPPMCNDVATGSANAGNYPICFPFLSIWSRPIFIQKQKFI